MADDHPLTEEFEASRPRLRAVAHRMLGSRAEADDAVQEAWLRLARTDADRIDNLAGWLTTVVARLCLDRLRSRRARPEESLGIQPPDEASAGPGRAAGHTGSVSGEGDDPADDVVMADSIGAALFVVLDSLGPAERVAFVLHDVFAVPFENIGEVVGRSPEAARQLASRARRRLQGSSPRAAVDFVRQRELVAAFLRAARNGDFEALVQVLDPDVELVPDAAAQRMGALAPARGARDIASLLAGGARAGRLAIVDGLAGLVWMPGGRLRGVVQFTIAGDRIVAINVTGDPERIEELEIVTLDA